MFLLDKARNIELVYIAEHVIIGRSDCLFFHEMVVYYVVLFVIN